MRRPLRSRTPCPLSPSFRPPRAVRFPLPGRERDRARVNVHIHRVAARWPALRAAWDRRPSFPHWSECPHSSSFPRRRESTPHGQRSAEQPSATPPPPANPCRGDPRGRPPGPTRAATRAAPTPNWSIPVARAACSVGPAPVTPAELVPSVIPAEAGIHPTVTSASPAPSSLESEGRGEGASGRQCHHPRRHSRPTVIPAEAGIHPTDASASPTASSLEGEGWGEGASGRQCHHPRRHSRPTVIPAEAGIHPTVTSASPAPSSLEGEGRDERLSVQHSHLLRHSRGGGNPRPMTGKAPRRPGNRTP